MIWIILLTIIIIIAVWFIVTYNKFVSLKAGVEEAFSCMDVFMKKRYDLIPNIVATVKGYEVHETSTLQAVVEARGRAVNSSQKQRSEAEGELTNALSKLLMLQESYPELKADSHFKKLSESLTVIESEIEKSRRYYNGIVRKLNEYACRIPSCIIASMMKIEKAEYFEASEVERENVKVKFN